MFVFGTRKPPGGVTGSNIAFIAGDAGDRQGALRGAVVGDRARQDLVLGRHAAQLPIVLGELERGLHGLAAAGREEHPVQVARGVPGEAVGEFDRRGVRVRPQREEGELLSLLGRGLGETRTAVAGVDHEQPGQAVDVLLAGVVPDVVSLTPPDDDRHPPAAVHSGLPGEVHPEVIVCFSLQIGAHAPILSLKPENDNRNRRSASPDPADSEVDSLAGVSTTFG